MALSNYTDLVAEMGDWLNRADLSAKIPTFIRLFEARMNRRLRNPDMEQTFSFNTTAGQTTYNISSRVRELREVYTSATGDVPNYTVIGEQIAFDADPGDGLTVYYSGFTTLNALGSSTTTNWLLDDHPDAYLFGSLCMAEAYLKDDQRVAVWKSAWDEALSEIIREGNSKRLPAGPLQIKPAVIE